MFLPCLRRSSSVPRLINIHIALQPYIAERVAEGRIKQSFGNGPRNTDAIVFACSALGNRHQWTPGRISGVQIELHNAPQLCLSFRSISGGTQQSHPRYKESSQLKYTQFTDIKGGDQLVIETRTYIAHSSVIYSYITYTT